MPKKPIKNTAKKVAKKAAKKAVRQLSLGRPGEYKRSFNTMVYKLCLLGAVDREIADFFGIDETTLNDWKHKYPSFSQSIKRGKEPADAKIVESLFKKGNGYSHADEKVFCHEGNIVVHKTTKHYPPDTAACMAWLRNRRRNNPFIWSNNPEPDDVPVPVQQTNITNNQILIVDNMKSVEKYLNNKGDESEND